MSRMVSLRGISLVEIMIVIVIIGIMAAIMPASLSSMVTRAEREVQRATAERLADGAIGQAQVTPLAEIDTNNTQTTQIEFQDRGRSWTVEYGIEYELEVQSLAGQDYTRITTRVFWPAGSPNDPVGEVLRTTMRTQ